MWSLLFCAQAHAQALVYSLSYSDTAASRQLRFANVPPMPGLRSEQENIELLRNTRENEIYSISIPDGKRSLLFNDAGMRLEIRAWGSVSSTAKAYTAGVWRERRTTPTPGYYSDEGIYELSLDGSNQARKLADAKKQGRAILNPQATKGAAQGADGQSILIYSVPDWKLLATLDPAKLSKAHCPACTPASYGWMADGNRLYVELVVVGEEDEYEAKADHPGTYILSGDGTDLGAIPAAIGAFQLAGYVHPKFIDRHFLGQLPDGRYLFQDYGTKQGKPINQFEPFLVISGADPKLQEYFPLKFPIGDCYISPSGRYIAYLERRQTPDYRSEQHLWVKDLDLGEEKELAAAPPPNPPSSPEPNVALFVLGWMH
jgi:hypothetical protein